MYKRQDLAGRWTLRRAAATETAAAPADDDGDGDEDALAISASSLGLYLRDQREYPSIQPMRRQRFVCPWAILAQWKDHTIHYH